MDPASLDFAPHEARAGFRLHPLEVGKWGTVDQADLALPRLLAGAVRPYGTAVVRGVE